MKLPLFFYILAYFQLLFKHYLPVSSDTKIYRFKTFLFPNVIIIVNLISVSIMTNSTTNLPIEDRYFEDYVPGSVYEFGSIVVEEEDILYFAKRYDPQAFHLDRHKAKEGPFGGLTASGWHTAALTMRLLVDHFLSKVAAMGSPGSGPIRFLRPVRPGDELSIRVTILEANRSRSKPDRGIIRAFLETMNQHREVVMTREGIAIIRCRNKP
jgi:acyl dehydratase